MVGGAVALALALRLAYVLATLDHTLMADEEAYDEIGRFAADGDFLWSTIPYGDPHASMWKAPGYPAWVGLVYAILGAEPDRLFAAQVIVFTPLTIGLAWLLGRRLFTPAVGVVTAFAVAIYPNAWQFDVRLYPEVVAIPLTLGVLILTLTWERISLRHAALTGIAIAVLVLVKPSSLAMLAPVAIMWVARCGWRSGAGRFAVTLLAMVLVIAPWSIRNHNLEPDHFIPISIQNAAAYGVFNDDAANDREHPWAWRPVPARDRDLLETPRSEGEFYAELNRRAREYLEEHPTAFFKALYYNGFTRLWDLRPPGDVLREVAPQGRTRAVAIAGLAMYWPLLALALVGLVLLWRAGRRALVLAVLALALAASVVHVSVAVTRYRAVYEPLIVVLAASVVVPPAVRAASRRGRAADPAVR